MSEIFLTIINMSIAASIFLLIVIALRLIFKRIPKRYFCILWAAAAIRLVLPFSLPQIFGMQSAAEGQEHTEVTAAYTQEEEPSAALPEKGEMDSYIFTERSAENNAPENADEKPFSVIPPDDSTRIYAAEQSDSETISEKASAPDDVQPVVTVDIGGSASKIASLIWLVGMMVVGLYGILSCVRIYRIVRNSIPDEKNIFICKNINTSFILGLIRPRIYLPDHLSAADRDMILRHEKSHIRCFDQLKKTFAFLLLMVHWFNPLVWVAYFMFCCDVEIACDERVITELGGEKQKSYASLLLQFSIRKDNPSTAALYFDEVAVKERIKEILRYRRPTAGVTILCALMVFVIAAAACTGSSPISVNSSADNQSSQTTDKKDMGVEQEST